ncbi:MAG: hypothetical protein ABL953_12705 [Ilumatobacteraceae bacterium]
MRRTLILSALGTTAMVIGIGVGAAMASADPPQPSPIATHTMMAGCPMTGMTGMTGMQMMMGSSMMDDQVPATANGHAAHHQEVRP